MRSPEYKTNKVIMLNECLKEAKRLFVGIDILQAIKYYEKIQEKIVRFTSDIERSDDAYARWMLCKLITDVFEPDYNWQKVVKEYENN
ncbi:MAG: hypothetical protein AMXMBFR51_20870 [Ignavibacteriota bacterium]